MIAPDGFWEKVDRASSSGCWRWKASINVRHGYGQVRHSGTVRAAHIVAYESLVGAVPDGLELDHTCRNRACVNPAHLEPVTHAENVRRGSRAQQVACKRGHPFDATNTAIKVDAKGRSSRRCRTCHRDAERRRAT